MNLLTLTDVGGGRLRLSLRRGDEQAQQCPQPVSVSDPLSETDRADLRWYLEKYLEFPYGAERWKAQQVERRMAGWGEALFEQVFATEGPHPTPRQLYEEALRDGLGNCGLCLGLGGPALLSLHWELLRDPAPDRGFLAPLLGGLYRHHAGTVARNPAGATPDGPFRILLVVARPYGKKDVALSTVARPLLEALRPLRPRVQLDLLRPPTLETLTRCLKERFGYYHLVHFDGHGVFARGQAGRSAPRQSSAHAGRGHLVFETKDGTPDLVNSRDLGRALAACRVPLFVLNACQSAEEGGRDPFSSVASQLVATGARGVVAMAYSVCAEAASRFMKRLYERLVDHASLAEAVAAARRALFSDPRRESVAGALELRDWMVPTLYQQEGWYVPVPQGVAAPMAAGEQAGPGQVLHRPAADQCPGGRYGFIGRDYDLLRLERALRDQSAPWVLVSGLGGVGKTELAYGFARWFTETGGCPGGVFATSFKHKADFGQVIGSIVGHGTEFSRLPAQQQFDWLVDHLRRTPCLLVWDNFEPVAGYPVGATPLATAEERDRLARFLQALRGGNTRVVITSRKPAESWLGIACQSVELDGLVPQDAAGLARSILRTVGRRPEDFGEDPEYVRLLRLLLGHPRSLEVVLPHLRRRSPSEIVQALQHRLGPLSSVLDESLDYVFTELSGRARRHLPFIGLFASCVYLKTLRAFVSSGDEQEETYREVVGETLDVKGWEAVLEEAASVGLVRPLSGGLYGLHPTFPAFLRQRLEAVVGAAGVQRLDAGFLKSYAALATSLDKDVTGGNIKGVMVVAVEEPNLLRALDLARAMQEWDPAYAIVQTLGQFYQDRGRQPELDAFRSRLLEWVGREMPEGADPARADLWMHLLGGEAIAAIGCNDLARAENVYQRILRYLAPLQAPACAPKTAVCYHQLGIIAQHRGRFEDAEQWYRRALEVYDRLELDGDAAGEYHQLGMIAQERQRFDEAGQWYRRALEVFERLGLERDAADEYHQLGLIARERQRFDEAEQWHRRTLEVYERMGLERDAAGEYHQLGMIAQDRQRFDEAEQWYRRALEIRERLGLERGTADEYHQLGIIAQERQRFDEAEQWYRRALEVFERMGLERDVADEYYQLGMIAQERRGFDEAEQGYRRALEVYERLGLERDAARAYHQLGRVTEEQQRFDGAEQWYRRALEVFERLGLERDAARAYHQFGRIAQQRQRFEEAEQWYRRALEVHERLGLKREAASGYHQLGNVAFLQRRFDRAERWCRRALETRERLGLEREAASDYHQLGMIAQERQRFDQAEHWYRRALEVYERLGHPPLRVRTLAQLGVLRRQQDRPREAVAWHGRALRVAAEHQMEVAGQISAHLAALAALMGGHEFQAAWQEAFPGEEPPLKTERPNVNRAGRDKPNK